MDGIIGKLDFNKPIEKTKHGHNLSSFCIYSATCYEPTASFEESHLLGEQVWGEDYKTHCLSCMMIIVKSEK
jgi:hypothetical protein